MLFNSFVFPVFLVIVWTLYICLKRKPQNVLLLVASYVFYSWWDWRFLSLLFISTLTDYVISQYMGQCGETQQRKRKVWLWISLCINLGILGFFKYFNFFAESFERVVAPFGLQADFVTLNILLPVGISFYTFQTMAYTIDVYRGKEKPCKNFLDFALYVAYFPQLVAGPIERSTNLIPQFQKDRELTRNLLYSSFRLIFWGYFLKVFVADGVAPYVNQCFSNPKAYGGRTLLMGAYLFALQIYGDFAGYTHIARGASRLFGIELCLNFRQPYLSGDITEFWRRWHISLSSWLRDYLYIPLGGNRKGVRRTYINLILTMLLGGLWHGAAWTFVIWGGLHGLYLAVHKFTHGGKVKPSAPPKTFSQHCVKLFWIVGTFHLVCLTWIFFRANSLTNALAYITGIAHWSGPKISGMSDTLFFYFACVLLIDIFCEIRKSEVPVLPGESTSWRERIFNNWLVRGTIYAIALFLIVFIGGENSEPFIYFQF
ncbi:MAG: MBOAT family protein [Planctomycetaceae bacterium]|jgi:D-alanyl-lipoteichoic acid acyltransferase DltB (MBOAT superfamily)|nr:MBOAT family protein [Planctomycetaceae bacterium]